MYLQPTPDLNPEERTRLLTIGAELKHQVDGLVSVVQPRTYHDG